MENTHWVLWKSPRTGKFHTSLWMPKDHAERLASFLTGNGCTDIVVYNANSTAEELRA